MSDAYLKTLGKATSVLLFAEGVSDAAYNEIVQIEMPDGTLTEGQVLDSRDGLAVIQALAGTRGVGLDRTKIRFTGRSARLRVSADMLGRVFDGGGRAADGLGKLVGGEEADINGGAINPIARLEPSEFIQTGISTIDGLNTLVRGQKLPIFSGFGMPHNRIIAQIARQAKLIGARSSEDFAVVFGGIGMNSEEVNFFYDEFERTGAMARSVMFVNRSSDPAMERIMVPRLALTAAEHLAFQEGYHVLVLMSDMTNYCESLREVSAAREEVPGRRGYPGYMYTDLASIYERAGKRASKKGSITQIPVLTMPNDDITHPVPDLTGYITEGQIVLSRGLHRKNIYPNVDALLSLSRLMNNGIGQGHTREDHRQVADQIYAFYARGKELRSLTAIVGEEALTEEDREYLGFADSFEARMVAQGYEEERSIDETLDLGWELISGVRRGAAKRVKDEYAEKYGKWKAGDA